MIPVSHSFCGLPICRVRIRYDNLISALSKANILSATKAKRARVAAHVRTKATHAQWDEFDEDDLSTAVGISKP